MDAAKEYLRIGVPVTPKLVAANFESGSVMKLKEYCSEDRDPYIICLNEYSGDISKIIATKNVAYRVLTDAQVDSYAIDVISKLSPEDGDNLMSLDKNPKALASYPVTHDIKQLETPFRTKSKSPNKYYFAIFLDRIKKMENAYEHSSMPKITNGSTNNNGTPSPSMKALPAPTTTLDSKPDGNPSKPDSSNKRSNDEDSNDLSKRKHEHKSSSSSSKKSKHS
jgi:hypothetical protein